MIRDALLLAAGFGERMLPLTASTPKPLLEVGGLSLIEHLYNRFLAVGVDNFVINSHYCAEQIESYFGDRSDCEVIFEPERLETGGAVVNALHCGLLGGSGGKGEGSDDSGAGFWIGNSDSIWFYDGVDSLLGMVESWDSFAMDGLLLLCPLERVHGYHGVGDFTIDGSGCLRRYSADIGGKGYVFCGVQIANRRAFLDYTVEYFSLNRFFDAGIESGRLYGYILGGDWWHVGTPGDLAIANKRLASEV